MHDLHDHSYRQNVSACKISDALFSLRYFVILYLLILVAFMREIVDP